MSPNPKPFLDHLRESGYHPRSDRHSNALAEQIALDLAHHCPRIRDKAADGELVFDLNFTLQAGTADWNVDLVLGPPALGDRLDPAPAPIRRSTPSSVEIAVEIKSVMTEHRKAVKNRKRDLEAHHEHVHNYSRQAVAGGVFVVNAAETFKSPLRPETTRHNNPSGLVKHCISELRSVASRGGSTGYGLEARCAIVVDMDNQRLASTAYLTNPPAPRVGDPLHYDAFVQSICRCYAERF